MLYSQLFLFIHFKILRQGLTSCPSWLQIHDPLASASQVVEITDGQCCTQPQLIIFLVCRLVYFLCFPLLPYFACGTSACSLSEDPLSVVVTTEAAVREAPAAV